MAHSSPLIPGASSFAPRASHLSSPFWFPRPPFLYIRNMNFKSFAPVVLSAAVVALAAPAQQSTASIVANAQKKGYSLQTRDKFINSCKMGVELPVCKCVLTKLEAKYDEATFKRYEAELAKGKEDPSYFNFIVQSTTECGDALDAASGAKPAAPATAAVPAKPAATPAASAVPAKQAAPAAPAKPAPAAKPAAPAKAPANQAVSLSPEEMMILMALLQSPVFKDNFVKSCTEQSMEWLGTKQADKTCRCAMNRVTSDQKFMSRIIASVGTDGSNIDFEKWGFDFIEPCIPKQYPPEMDNAFVKECLKQKDVTKPTCECVLQSIKKDYTIHSLMKTAFEDRKRLETDITLKSAQCLSK